MINAAEYGYQQRRRRTFIFAYKNDTNYAKRIKDQIRFASVFSNESLKKSTKELMTEYGFFAKSFPVEDIDAKKIRAQELPAGLGELSDHFQFTFENSGVMINGVIYTARTTPVYEGNQITLGDIMENGDVDEQFFIPEHKLY